MRIPSGKTDVLIYFVAVDATDLKTRETGLSGFTVYRSRNGGAATAYTTPTVTELSAANMPGVYALTVDEDTTIAAGSDSEEYVVHITQAAMAPVTRTIELYRRDTTSGQTLTVTSGGVTLADGVSHGGTLGSSTATLALSRASIVSQSANTAAFTVTGNGSGEGFDVNGGATGAGATFTGGGTSGAGATFTATSGNGMTLTGGTNGSGIRSNGAGTGAGVYAQGGATAQGILAGGGATSGDGFAASATSGNGMTLTGGGNGSGIRATPGSTGTGLRIDGGATSGPAISAIATNGNAVTLTAGTQGAGIRADGAGTGAGIYAQGGATGEGILAGGGATSGAGIRAAATSGNGATFTGGTNGHGIGATGAGTGDGMELTGGGTGVDLDANLVGTITGNMTGDITGNLSGSVGSVTGNVGGNVTGSVGSVAAGGITAASIATDAIDADAIAASAVTEIQSGLSTLNAAAVSAAVWDAATASYGAAGSYGLLVETNLDAAVSSRLSTAGYTAPDNASISTILSDTNDIQTRLPAALVGGRMDASVGAMAANVLTAAATAADFGAEIADAVHDEVVDGVTTFRESTRLHNSALGGKASGLDTTTAVYRDLADTKDRISATVDVDGNRTAVTRDLT